jgi:2-amino-4-hydroxy-6-hydroxymethyldihydropteridine diphosphokinase
MTGRQEAVTRRVRAYIGLGSNVGDPPVTLARAVRALAMLPGARVRAVSPLYATTPVGVHDQADFLNAVVALDVPAGPDPETGAVTLLGQLKAIERELGRQVRARWGPREVDLDLLLFGRHTVEIQRPGESADRPVEPGAGPGEPAAEAGPGEGRQGTGDGPSPELKLLQVPHRDVADRLFVLAPLAQLAPRLVPPGWRESVRSASRRRAAIEGVAAARAIGPWDSRAGRWQIGQDVRSAPGEVR